MNRPRNTRSLPHRPLLRALVTATALLAGLGLGGCERRVGEGSHTPSNPPKPDSRPDSRPDQPAR